jgi:hypothetical protein
MNAKIKQFVKNVSPNFILHPALRLRSRLRNKSWSELPVASVFASIYHNRSWGGDSVSGMGSDPEQTQSLRHNLPQLLETYHIHSILDVPCEISIG